MTHDAKVYVIHDNPDWFGAVRAPFDAAGIPVEEWLLTEGSIDLAAAPPQGVFWSRLSASAHTRGNARSKEYGRAVLSWLERSGRTVVNGSRVLELEVSKAAQHAALTRAGIETPRTTAVFGRTGLAAAARTFPAPFIVKHNQGGKGLSVRRFDSHGEFEYYLASADFEEPIDGITLVQEHLLAAAPFVTRAEFVDGRFLYAVRVDTSSGEFELCPAGPGGETAAPPAPVFSLREDFAGHPIIARFEAFLAENGISIAGIEFIETIDGRLVTYDVNTNTNYNPEVEAAAERAGASTTAAFLGALLQPSESIAAANV